MPTVTTVLANMVHTSATRVVAIRPAYLSRRSCTRTGDGRSTRHHGPSPPLAPPHHPHLSRTPLHLRQSPARPSQPEVPVQRKPVEVDDRRHGGLELIGRRDRRTIGDVGERVGDECEQEPQPVREHGRHCDDCCTRAGSRTCGEQEVYAEHTSIAGFERPEVSNGVLMAEGPKVTDGKVVEFNRWSGHYKPQDYGDDDEMLEETSKRAFAAAGYGGSAAYKGATLCEDDEDGGNGEPMADSFTRLGMGFSPPVPATEMTEVSVERLSAAAIRALTDRARDAPPAELTVDRSVLATFLDTLLGELPWWNRAWRVAEVAEVHKSSSALALPPGDVQVVEVTVRGSLGGAAGEVQLFSARVRLLEDRLLRWQMKVGDTVIGPAVAPTGEPEPHPFGAVFQMLVEMRGLSLREVAWRAGRADSTIMKLLHGALVPERALINQLARALNVPAANLALIAGVDPADPGGQISHPSRSAW